MDGEGGGVDRKGGGVRSGWRRRRGKEWMEKEEGLTGKEEGQTGNRRGKFGKKKKILFK